MVEFPMHILYVNFLEEKLNFLCAKIVKFRYSEKATKFCEISALLFSVCTVDKSKVEISKIFVAFSEYTNFTMVLWSHDILKGHHLTNQNLIATTLDARYQARNLIPNEESKYLGPQVTGSSSSPWNP